MDLKFKTKIKSPKNILTTKLPIAKLKEIKSNQPILPKTNNLALQKILNKIFLPLPSNKCMHQRHTPSFLFINDCIVMY